MKNKPNRIDIQNKLNRNKGFTLVELLVTITIIVVLAALTFSLTQRIRAKAFQANALSSLRQVGVVSVSYATENNGDINTMRFSGDPKEGGGSTWVKNTFWGRLQPYLFTSISTTNQAQLSKEIKMGMNQLFNTPNSSTMANTLISSTRIYHDTSGLPVPVAFNAVLAPWGKFAKVTTFSDPSQVLYMTYGFGLFNEVDGLTYEPMPVGGSAIKNNIYYLKDRTALAACLDGHVESVSAPIPDRRFK